MRVLFLTADRAHGEATIGLALGRQLRAVGDEVHFLGGERHIGLFRASGFPFTIFTTRMLPWTSMLLDRLVRDFKPDLIVPSDYLIWNKLSAPAYNLAPWSILKYGVPVVPIDIYEFAETPFRLDLFPGLGQDISRCILDLPATLRPVPFCHFEASAHGSWPVALVEFDGPGRLSASRRRAVRAELGISAESKLVMLPLARWQLDFARMFSAAPAGFGNVATGGVELLGHILQSLSDEVRFVLLGAAHELAERLPGRAHVVPECDMETFGGLLQAADLFLSMNLASTGLARAILAGIPALALVNSFAVSDHQELIGFLDATGQPSYGPEADASARMLPIYPFVSWPLSLSEFTKPLFRDNPVLMTFARAEFLDAVHVRNKVHDLLFDPLSRYEFELAGADYLARIRACNHPHDVLANVLGHSGRELLPDAGPPARNQGRD